MRGSLADLRAGRARAGGARSRQRHRGGQDVARGGDGVPPVLPVPCPLPLREPLLQPVLRQREGLRGERRRLHPEKPARPRAVGRVPRGAERAAGGRVRAAERRLAVPRRAPGYRGSRRGPRGDGRASGGPLRRRQVGAGARRQARLRDGRRP